MDAEATAKGEGAKGGGAKREGGRGERKKSLVCCKGKREREENKWKGKILGGVCEAETFLAEA